GCARPPPSGRTAEAEPGRGRGPGNLAESRPPADGRRSGAIQGTRGQGEPRTGGGPPGPVRPPRPPRSSARCRCSRPPRVAGAGRLAARGVAARRLRVRRVLLALVRPLDRPRHWQPLARSRPRRPAGTPTHPLPSPRAATAL
ncbi:MAG: hypothetical protein AVDCRST_MAG59-3510, partial [uncultured Thermomicrobiales bacterium]